MTNGRRAFRRYRNQASNLLCTLQEIAIHFTYIMDMYAIKMILKLVDG